MATRRVRAAPDRSSTSPSARLIAPHLKTEEFYRECAARLSDRGVFISNLHATSQLYYSDIKTIQKVFPQVVLFEVLGRGQCDRLRREVQHAGDHRAPRLADAGAGESPRL
ncbi:MAG: hypothetical protein V4773_22685 [Verrucomicrobiota bacterium]